MNVTATYSAAIDALNDAHEHAAGGHDDAALDELASIAKALDLLDHITRAAVDAARKDGMTWVEIGYRLGVTKQAAQQRYGTRKQPPHRDVDPQLPLDEGEPA